MKMWAWLAAMLLPLVTGKPRNQMEVLYSWSQVDFVFPSESLRDVYLASGQFIPKNNLILDVDVWSGGRKEGAGGLKPKQQVIVTLPKFKPGVPVTLAKVTSQRRNGTTLLQPYPDWSWHHSTDTPDCDGITSVYRTTMDDCGRLWVLDTGVVESFINYRRLCPPQILIFDMETNTLIKRYRFPDSVLDRDSLLITIVVDTANSDCLNSHAYISDVGGFKLIIYDNARDKSWRIVNNLFYPYPLQGDFHINGVDFELMDGIFGLALGPVRSSGDRTLYYHSLASVHESWVHTSVIQNASLFRENPGASPRSFHVFGEARSSQAAAQDMTDSGILLYSLVEDNAIGCWNSHQPFKKQHFDTIAKNDVTLQFQSGLKVYGNHIWTISNRLQNYIVDDVRENEVNMRINVGRLSDLLHNTKCDVRQGPSDSSTLVFPSNYFSSSYHSTSRRPPPASRP